MGRPLRKDINGISVIGSFSTVSAKDPKAAGIRVEFHDGSALRTDGVIIRQRGAKTYVVARDGSVTENLTQTPNVFTCVLQAAEPSAEGQMRIRGSLDGTTPGNIAIAKLTKRVATDFDGNRYNWEMTNFEDSTGDAIKLTAI
jgi:hypothetical protein